jgi:hypothetical protein
MYGGVTSGLHYVPLAPTALMPSNDVTVRVYVPNSDEPPPTT